MSDDTNVAVVPAYRELSVLEVENQVQKIQTLMIKLMHEGEHYGASFPGDKKKNLLKAGADKLCFMFRFRGEYDIREKELPNDHLEVVTKCTLYHIETGQKIAEGIGSCSTREAKYRWRKDCIEKEVGIVPKAYWAISRDDPDSYKKREAVLVELYGPGKYKTKKKEDGWKVLKVEGDDKQIENPNIADSYNTVRKISKKRAYVDATISACAASDLFTQDLEDIPPEDDGAMRPVKEEDPSGPSPAKDEKPDATKPGDPAGAFNMNDFVAAVQKLPPKTAQEFRKRMANAHTDTEKLAILKEAQGGEKETAVKPEQPQEGDMFTYDDIPETF